MIKKSLFLLRSCVYYVAVSWQLRLYIYVAIVALQLGYIPEYY
jgi:hypothetical protein